MIGPTNSQATAPTTTTGDPPVTVTPAAATTVGVTPADGLSLQSGKQPSGATPVSLMTDPAHASPSASAGAKTDPPVPTKSADNPWRVTSVNVRFGPHLAFYGNTDIHFSQPGYGNDVTLHGVAAKQRTTFDAFYHWAHGWPQYDEPQSSTGISAGFANGWGLEANLKHNKYIVEDRHQEVLYTGTLNGQAVDAVRPLDDFVGQYEISGGLNQVSLLATHTTHLPAFSPKDRFSLITKAGPSGLLTWTNSNLRNPSGQMEEGPRRYHIGGYGFVAENELRYEVRKKVSFSVAHSVGYANVVSSEITGGHAKLGIWANQLAFGLGYTFNPKDKHHKPAPEAPVAPAAPH